MVSRSVLTAALSAALVALSVPAWASSPGDAAEVTATEDAEHFAILQYFPPESERGGAKPPVVAQAFGAAQQRPVRFGIGFQLGSHNPLAGDTGLLGERFTSTFDLGGSVFVNWYEMLQVDFAVRGLAGGLEVEPWEEDYGLIDPSSRHLWLGLHARFSPVALGRFRPMVSAAYGGNRVIVVEERPNGDYSCRDTVFGFDCTQDTDRTFTGGYWGQTFAVGGGFRTEPGPRGRFSFQAEALYGVQRYGRQTVNVTSREVRSAGPITHELIILAGAQLYLN